MKEASATARKHVLDKIISALTSNNIELLLMDLGTSHAKGVKTMPMDLCVLDEDGLELAREARGAGYTGRIVAVQGDYEWECNRFNVSALKAIRKHMVGLIWANYAAVGLMRALSPDYLPEPSLSDNNPEVLN